MNSIYVDESTETLCFDGKPLLDFIDNRSYFAEEITKIYKEIHSDDLSLRDLIIKALERLGIERGIPPISHPHVMENIVDFNLEFFSHLEDKSICEEKFTIQFKNVAKALARDLKNRPLRVSHRQTTLNGRVVHEFLSRKEELDRVLDDALKKVMKELDGTVSMFSFKERLSDISASTLKKVEELPVDEFEKAINAVHNYCAIMTGEDDTRMVAEVDYKKDLIAKLQRFAYHLDKHPAVVSEEFYLISSQI